MTWPHDVSGEDEIIPPVVGVPAGPIGFVPHVRFNKGPFCGAIDDVTGVACDRDADHNDLRHLARFPDEGLAFAWQ